MKKTLPLVCLLLTAGQACAEEISSNAVGGGAWSDPATWRGKTVPGPKDDVVIQKYDVVTFDRNDDGKTTCRKLQIDPKGMLACKTGAGKLVCCVADVVENYGVIKIDGTKSAKDFLELRLVGDTAERRRIKLGKNSALLLYGKSGLPDGKCNVMLSSPKLPEQKEELLGLVDNDGPVSFDWQRSYIQNVKLVAKKIDNTGAKRNERINIVECQFSGHGQLSCQSCDTPVISKNTFEYKGEKGARLTDEGAIHLTGCPLSEVKGNTVRGGFHVGIWFTYQSDAVLVGNKIENCTHGISGAYGITNSMVKQCEVRRCDHGIVFWHGSGVIEETLIEGSGTTGFALQAAQVQLTNVQIKDTAAKGTVFHWQSGTASLLNCNVAPAQIKFDPPAAKADPIAVTCLQYVVIGAKQAPAGSLAELRTSTPALPADAADPNVRNSPAPLTDGLTPLPKTLNSLIVKAWVMDDKGKMLPRPQYVLKILGPAAKEGAVRPVLHTMTFQPLENALRSTPADATPTLEVTWK